MRGPEEEDDDPETEWLDEEDDFGEVEDVNDLPSLPPDDYEEWS